MTALEEGKRFSDAVREAWKLGYTEPDPREDLSGVDVARKLIILGREMGLEVEMDAVQVESMVPEDLRSASVAEYLNTLGKHDETIGALGACVIVPASLFAQAAEPDVARPRVARPFRP